LSCSCGRLTKPVRTIFSDSIFNFTFPTMGTQPHATGAVHNAALYGTFPLTAGRCGWVDGNRCSETEGERISCGMGVVRMFGSKGESVRNAVVWVFSKARTGMVAQEYCSLFPSLRVRSSGGL
jgi:hypothetical protein